MAYQLLRTNTSLTGNVQLYCKLKSSNIESISMYPLNTLSYSSGISVNYENSTYGADLVTFYKSNSGDFYKPTLPTHLNTKYRVLDEFDPYVSTRINYHEYGVSRVSKSLHGAEFGIFAPIMIQNTSDIPDYLEIQLQKYDTNIEYPVFKHRVNLSVNASNPLYKYIYNSISDFSELGNNIKMMNISPANRESYVVGRSVTSGSIEYIKSNLPIQLYSKDQTYLEFNSKIINEYSKYNLVSPYIFNISYTFNLVDIFYNITGFIETGATYNINLRYYKSGEIIPMYDFDTNHDFILNYPQDEDDLSDNTTDYNILDYNREYDIPSIKNNNRQKLLPYICKWVLANSNDDYYFNNIWGYEVASKLYDENQMYGINFKSKDTNSSVNNTYWADDMINSDGKEKTFDNVTRFPVSDYQTIIRGVKYDISKIDGIDANKINGSTLVSISNYKYDNIEDSNFVYISMSKSGYYATLDFYNNTSEDEIISNLTNISFAVYIKEYGGNSFISVGENEKISLYDALIYPDYIKIYNPVSSQIIEGTEDERELVILNDNNIGVRRYSGWIYPKLIKMEENTYKLEKDSYIFLHDKILFSDATDSTDNLFISINTSDSLLQDKDINLYDSISYNNRSKLPDIGTYNEYPDTFSKVGDMEYKWFFDSKITYLTDEITFTSSYPTSTSIYIYETCISYLTSYYNIDTEDSDYDYIINYIYNCYDVTVSREPDSSTYTTYLELK